MQMKTAARVCLVHSVFVIFYDFNSTSNPFIFTLEREFWGIQVPNKNGTDRLVKAASIVNEDDDDDDDDDKLVDTRAFPAYSKTLKEIVWLPFILCELKSVNTQNEEQHT